MRYSSICLLLLGLCAVPSIARAQNCIAPDTYAAPDKPLSGLQAALRKGDPIQVLAIGSATTVGEHADGEEGASFPYRATEALRTGQPPVTTVLRVLGGKGMTAAAMVPLLQGALKQQPAAVVLWQTGTVEAVRGVKPETFRADLAAGIAAARAAGAEVVLIDPQFSRYLRANTDLDPYHAELRSAASAAGVTLFHRFDLMRAWANEGRIDLEKVAKAERGKAVAELHSCLGHTLARFLLAGAR